MAINKSKSFLVLLENSIYYMFFLFIGSVLFVGGYAGITREYYNLNLNNIMLFNAPSHFIIDTITSRINAKLFQSGKRHW